MNETELARMVVRLLGDSTSYVGMLRGAVSATTQATAVVERQAAQVEGYGRNLTGFAQQVKYSLLGAVGVLGIFGTAMNALQRSGEAEDIRTSFGVMLQDMRSGEVLVRRIQQLAAETPLETRTLTAAAKTLLQFNAVAANEVVPTLRMIGDTVGGRAEELSRMAYAFGQVGATGRLMGQDLMQMINAGFNPLQEISRTTGKSLAQLKDDMEKGLITFDMVKNAFKTATSQGGRFFQGMEQGSKTLNGLFSTLKDDVGLTLQDVGDALVRGFDLKEVIKNLSQFAQEVRKWANVAADGLIFLKDNVNQFLLNNRELVVTAAQVAGALLGLWAVVRAGGLAVGLVWFAIRLLRIDLVVTTALWLAFKLAVAAVDLILTAASVTVKAVWTVAVLAANAAVWLFNAAMVAGEAIYAAVATTLSLVALGSMPAYTLGTIAAAAGTWLLNAALAVMDALLAPPLLVAAAAALGAVAAAALLVAAGVGVVASGFYAAWKAGGAFLDLLGAFGAAAAGPLGRVTDVLAGWENTLGNLTAAVQVDFALAWQFVGAYARLAVEQVKVLWPPLWEFIQSGFTIIWTEVTARFKEVFYKALLDVYTTSAETFRDVADMMIKSLHNPLLLFGDRADRQIAEVGEKLQGKIAENAGKHWELQMREAVKKLDDALKNVDQAGINVARENIKGLENALVDAQLDKIWDEAVAGSEVIKSGQAMANSLAPVTHAAHQAHAAVQELKGALVGSNQGFQRLLEQREFLENRNIGLSATGAQGRIAQTNINLKRTEQTLDDIKVNTARAADAPPLIIGVAGI